MYCTHNVHTTGRICGHTHSRVQSAHVAGYGTLHNVHTIGTETTNIPAAEDQAEQPNNQPFTPKTFVLRAEPATPSITRRHPYINRVN
ncbi:hypothetical protein PoB_006271900 [Plakobranchus ocellatus]|uniref:Uncharacterized protein n=1 Tax=Plakobranchus ocellatus TaxID=259542 RepID=A0AAV4CWD0_9GAST|nr:hypothetical protein PoB_006271900 [Plakobranchus ocellatus]